ncbi:tetratricopeptide repeat protein [Bdellovibrionota bacterium FG-2]
MPRSGFDQEIQDLLNQRQFDKAEKLIREWIEREPDSADAYYFLGVTFYFQGQLGQTVENLKTALSLDPHHTDASICLSVLYNDIGKYDDAGRVFDQANQSVFQKERSGTDEIDRKFAVKHLEIADLYYRYRRFDEAIEEYGKAILLDSETLDIRIRRAKAYAKKGFVTRALQELQQLKREHPDFLPGKLQLGLLHYSQANILDAELEWESVLELEPTNREASAYLELARKNRVKSAPAKN